MSTRLARIADGIMEAGWLAAIIFAPIFFNVFSSRIFEPDKITTVRSLALVILIAWIVKLLEQKRISWTKMTPAKNWFETIRQTPLLLPVAVMILSYLVSTVFSVTWSNSLLGSYQRLQGTYTFLSYIVVFAAIAANLRKRSQVERLITTIILTSLPISLYGILQRYQLDPIPWGGDTVKRVAANLGNSIFVAAYLIMALPLTIGRVITSFRDILKENQRQAIHIARASLYLFILILQLVCIYMSGSRGPVLGLLAGLYLMALLLSLMWGKRWLTLTVVMFAVVGGGLLALVNIPNGPLEFVRNSPLLGRFGTLLDTEANTAQVRYYIWRGASNLVLPHDPIQYPDGSKDEFNLLRPLIGYGPESMYVAFNPFYEPMLGHVERRNASPDRSHNETWDSLVTTGLFGFAAYIALFLIVVYFGLYWLGLVQTQRLKGLYWLLVLVGGVIGSVSVILWGGLPYLGVGLPFGLIAGVLIYIAIVALAGYYERPRNASEAARSLTMIVLLAAIIAHWVEINFGIAIVSTRLHFWSYVGLLFVVGLVLPKHGEYEIPAAAAQEQDESNKIQHAQAGDSSTRGRATKRTKRTTSRPVPAFQAASIPWLKTALFNGFIAASMMVALAYDYITNPTRAVNPFLVIITSFTSVASGSNTSLALVGLLIITVLALGLLYSAESEQVTDLVTWLKSSAVIIGIALVAMFFYSLIHASKLATLAGTTIENEAQLIEQVDSLGGLMTNLYFYLFLLIAGAGIVAANLFDRSQFTSGWGIIAGPILLIASAILIVTTNLQIIHADVAFKMADPFTSGDQWPIATRLYNHAISLAPNEDYYYLFIGRSYLEQAKLQTAEADQSAIVQQADQDLKVAQKINPLNTDHTANLARLYSWWATRTTDSAVKKQRGDISVQYYNEATALSRNSAGLYGETAVVYLNILGQPDQAKTLLDKALSLDSEYPFILGLVGDYYMAEGRGQSDKNSKVKSMEDAVAYYQKAVDASVGNDAGSKLTYMIAVGNGYLEMASIDPNNLDQARLQQAATAYLAVAAIPAKAADTTKIEEQLGRIYIQLNNKQEALIHLQKSLAAAATADKSRIQQLIDQVSAMP